MLYLHPESLSPDPTYGRTPAHRTGNRVGMDIYPHELLRAGPESPPVKQWRRSLNLYHRPPALALVGDVDRRVELLLDFGTELDGALDLEISAEAGVTLMACFGESVMEAEGLVPGEHPRPTFYWHLRRGRQHITSQPRGFRFVRLAFIEVRRPLTLHAVCVRAEFTFRERRGDFRCSDRRFQRVWQSSLYTARLCTREETIWDGIKRDRIGWYGDARIVKLAADNVFFDPRPSEAMLAALPTDQWANTIPNYSFDAIAMLKQHILFYGLDRPCVRPCFEKILKLLGWARRTQVNRDGFIIRTDRPYFGDIGFLDWSPFPPGGKFEELCWLQCKYLEALRNAADIAGFLGDAKTVQSLAPRIARLARLIPGRFWNERKGFIHTLNHIGISPRPGLCGNSWDYDLKYHPMFGVHYRKTYLERVRRGPSGASRQANALAVLAGLASSPMKRIILGRVFDNAKILPVVTAYFSYYEQTARAICGDPAGAIRHMRDYVGQMLEAEDAATIWEFYDPALSGMRKYSSNHGLFWTWPISLCHGWGAGAVPVAGEYLLGITPAAPGFRMVALNPCRSIPWSFEAEVPTPYGAIRVVREKPHGAVRYQIPKGIQITPETRCTHHHN